VKAIELFQSCLQHNRDQPDIWALVGNAPLYGCPNKSGACYLMNNDLPMAYSAYQSALNTLSNVCDLTFALLMIARLRILMYGTELDFCTIDMLHLTMPRRPFQTSSTLIPTIESEVKSTFDSESSTSNRKNIVSLLM